MSEILTSATGQKWVEDHIRVVPDFPRPGIAFFDVTSLLSTENGVATLANEMLSLLKDGNCQFDKIVAVDSRGFLIGSVLSLLTSAPLVLARKAGKLPLPTASRTYDLEYGQATIELQKVDVRPGDRVLVVDDILATGGTCKAVASLVEDMGAQVAGLAFLIVIGDVYGGELLSDHRIFSLSVLRESDFSR